MKKARRLQENAEPRILKHPDSHDGRPTPEGESVSASISYGPRRRKPKGFGPKAELIKFLRNHVSAFEWGTGYHWLAENGTLKKQTPSMNDEAAILRAFNEKAWSSLRRIPRRAYDAHFLGDETLYAAGRRFSKKDFKKGPVRTLIDIDVDCKTKGSAEGSLAFVTYLASEDCRDRYGIWFPKLYSEPSSGGKGRSAKFLYDYGDGSGTAQFKAGLSSRLKPLLNHIVREQGFDVENVEIKGTPAEIEWHSTIKGRITSYTFGTFARMPRDVDRVEELKNTTVLTLSDLMRLRRPIDEPKLSTRKPEAGKARSPKVETSTPCSLVDEDQIEKLPAYMALAAKIMGGPDATIKTTGRMVAKVEDLATALLFLEVYSENMNPDGSMPTERVRKDWTHHFQAGRLSRGYHTTRFKVVRDLLSSYGLLSVESMEYRPGTAEKKGTACRWSLSATLMCWLGKLSLLSLRVGGGSLDQHENVDAFTLPTPSDDYPVPTEVFEAKLHLTPAMYAEIDRIVGTWTPSGLAA